jgi:hypothetical protein
MKANYLWSLWQALLLSCAVSFTRPGRKRFAEWLTGLVLNVEEHTITQSLFALGRPADWSALEAFAEYGSWDLPALQGDLARLAYREQPDLWYGYRVSASDDTKVHRSSKGVWGTCTFHEYTARCPNRASTVRAHNWVVLGALLPQANQPACFLPLAGRLYFRKSQPPFAKGQAGPRLPFLTKCQLLVELARQHAKAVPGKHLQVFDGAYAVRSVVRPLTQPPDPGQPVIEVLTRLRHDARLFDVPPRERRDGQRGPTPRWGKRLPPPRQGGRWRAEWHSGQAFIYGKLRQVRWKEVVCLWWVMGPDKPVKAVVAEVEGYRGRFTLVCSATELTGLQIVELFCARFRQEDGFRDLKQRLGWEECRAWTRNPIERTTQVLFVALTLLRLLQFRLQERHGEGWWFHPPWNKGKSRPSVLDLGRLFRQHAEAIRQHLSAWLGNEEMATP